MLSNAKKKDGILFAASLITALIYWKKFARFSDIKKSCIEIVNVMQKIPNLKSGKSPWGD